MEGCRAKSGHFSNGPCVRRHDEDGVGGCGTQSLSFGGRELSAEKLLLQGVVQMDPHIFNFALSCVNGPTSKRERQTILC